MAMRWRAGPWPARSSTPRALSRGTYFFLRILQNDTFDGRKDFAGFVSFCLTKLASLYEPARV